MFMSQYYHTVDAKGRLIVPAKYREQLGDEFVITKGLDGCLFVYGNADWEILEKKLTSDPGGFERICGSGKRRSFSRSRKPD